MRATSATRAAALVLMGLGAAAGCSAPPPRPPLPGDAGAIVRDGGTDAPLTDALVENEDAPSDASPPPDAGSPDAPDGGPVTHPGTGTWAACVPENINRICYLLPGAIAAGGADRTLQQRIAIELDGAIHEAGSVPPFDLLVAPTTMAGEHPVAASSSASGSPYFELVFDPSTPLDGWAACGAAARRFRILRSGTTGVALEFELDCGAMPGVQIRGAVLGGSAFSGWRTDPIDGL